MVNNEQSVPSSSNSANQPRPQKLQSTILAIGAADAHQPALLQLLEKLDPANSLTLLIYLPAEQEPWIESSLEAIHSRIPLECKPIRDGLSLEVNSLYLIPNCGWTISQQRFHRSSESQFVPSLDQSITEVAQEFGESAVAILLQGTGTDGLFGLQAIKANNGLTFVQRPKLHEAWHTLQSNSSNSVDFVMAPHEIAEELNRISQHKLAQKQTSLLTVGFDGDQGEPDENYENLFRMLRNATQVDYANYKRSTIRRRIQRRLIVHRLNQIEEYNRFIEDNPGEIWALHRDLLIHVTRFFRDPESFDAICRTALTEICQRQAFQAPIRLWIPGCSTGEEAYSLAIGLLEILGERASVTPIRIFATDISEEALAQARTGIYGLNIANHVSPERLNRFFHIVNNGYQINKSIRELCVFARHDMTCDPPFSNLDLVSCRNVMIYLGPILQKRVLPLFHYALKPNRYLMLGSSETIGSLSDLFELVDATHRIYISRHTPKRVAFDFSAGNVAFSEATKTALTPPDRRGFQELRAEVDRVVLNHYAPSGVVVDSTFEILQFRGQTGNFLTPAPGNASLNVLKMAREGLLLGMRHCLETARISGERCQTRASYFDDDGNEAYVQIQVIPLQFAHRPCFTILFTPEDPAEKMVVEAMHPATPLLTNVEFEADEQRQIIKLHQELEATKEFLQSTIEELESSNEELKAANEEILSSNEELQSTNEELQTAKEELQASNEELQTVNDELHVRNREATKLGDDLTNLLRSVNIPMIMVGQDLRIRRFTPSASEVLNLIPTDIGRPIADLNSKLVGVSLEDWMSEVLDHLSVLEHEAQDQAGKWHRVCLRPYRTQENVIDGVVVSVIDIDTIKKSEQQIRNARDYAETIIGATHIPLLILDSTLRLLAINRACAEFLGMSHLSHAQPYITNLSHTAWEFPTLSQFFSDTLRQSNELHDHIVQHHFPNVGSKTLLLNSRHLGGTEDPQGTILVAMEDITDRERLGNMLREEQSRESQKLESIGRLAGGIAHDFNNLLTVINGYCEILRDRVDKQSEEGSMLAQIEAAGNNAASLTRQLLAYGRRQILQPQQVDLNQLLAEKEQMLARLLNENVQLRLHLCLEPALVWIDRSQMEQVLLNLCINARDAMPVGGKLILETCHLPASGETPPQIRLSIRDTGVGMDRQTLSNIFEPFFTTKDIGKGTGLGLATAFGIIKQSQGQIEATSQIGEGSCFTILLPSLTSKIVPHGNPIHHDLPNSQQTILVVEDEEAIRRLEILILESEGYRLMQAANGDAALKLCGTYPEEIHLLITDVVMPGINGHDLANSLRAFRPHIKVLYISGHSQELIRKQGIVFESSSFLQKPFTPITLLEKVRETLEN